MANGAKMDARDKDGQTPLHLAAAEHSCLEDCGQMIELLLAKGADVNARDNQGKTPLAIAEKFDMPTISDSLKKHGGTK